MISRWAATASIPGIPLALGSAVLFGAVAPISKLLLGSIDPWMLAGILYLGAGLGLLCILGVRVATGRASREAQLAASDMPWLALVVLFGGVAGPVLLMFGLSLTSASSGALLLNLESLATLGIAWIVFRENVDRRLLLGAAAILAGAVLLSWSGGGLRLDMGGLLIAAACLAWGIDNNLTRRLSAADPVQITAIKGLAAGVINLLIAGARGAHLPASSLVIAGGITGLLGVGASLVMFTLGLRHLGAARTGAYFATAPFIGAVIAVVFLSEPISLQLFLAGVLMAAGVYLHLTERHDHVHVHKPMTHKHTHVHDEHHRHTHAGPVSEPHSHEHTHERLVHRHPHFPDLHHRHDHS